MATHPNSDNDTPLHLAHPETAAVHAGSIVLPQNNPSSPPLYQSSAYCFADLDEVEAIATRTQSGILYGRYGGPNGNQFADAIATLEGAQAAVATSSGMSAINAVFATNVPHGKAIVASRDIYGGTFELLKQEYGNGRAQVIYVDTTDLAATEEALATHRPCLLYAEALTNPLIRVANLEALASLAHRYAALFALDATFASPVLIQPLKLGVDLVLHSVTKYISGHGDVSAGVLSGTTHRIQAAQSYLIRTGGTIPHFESWLALRGLRTLALRMTQHSKNAACIANYLQQQPEVIQTHHPSLRKHAQYELAQRLYPRGLGGMLAFDLRGGKLVVERFLKGLRQIKIVHSLGDVGTTIAYSAVASHRAVPAELREQLGVTEGTLRISAGIEHPDDIIADLSAAFAGLSSTVHA